MKSLDLICDNCRQKIQIDISDKDYRYYLTNGSFDEDSNAFEIVDQTFGWVVYRGIFCEGCKYKHVPFYREN